MLPLYIPYITNVYCVDTQNNWDDARVANYYNMFLLKMVTDLVVSCYLSLELKFSCVTYMALYPPV